MRPLPRILAHALNGLALAGLSLALGSCSNSTSLSSNPQSAVDNSLSVIAQIESPSSRPPAGPMIWASGLVAPAISTPALAFANVAGVNQVFNGKINEGNPYGTLSGSTTPMVVSPTSFVSACPGLNCYGFPLGRGVGGPNGDFQNDTFIRWGGVKGPDPSAHYSRIEFRVGGATFTDISSFRGIIFWARGHGAFAISLESTNDRADGPGQPYTDYNFYLKRFGAELNGDVEWKQVIVYFDEMVQEWGLAADKSVVLKKVRNIQFTQETPVDRNFLLDLDYIRLF